MLIIAPWNYPVQLSLVPYHGRAGFDTFSHRKSVLTNSIRPDPSLIYPPYKRWKDVIIRRVL